jgi:hypothetical protein
VIAASDQVDAVHARSGAAPSAWSRWSWSCCWSCRGWPVASSPVRRCSTGSGSRGHGRSPPRSSGIRGPSPASASTATPRTSADDELSGGARRAILLVPGATPSGRDDRRVVAIAEALARADRVVVVPELEVYGEDLVPADVDRLVALTGALAASHGPVVIAGISFGASLGLVAAADPQVAGEVALVATFGAYADLAGVVQAATTGVSLVGDQRIPWDPHPRALDVVREQLLGLLDADDRGRCRPHSRRGRIRRTFRASCERCTTCSPQRTRRRRWRSSSGPRRSCATASPRSRPPAPART